MKLKEKPMMVMPSLRTRAPLLSKTRFLAGLQCPLRLWHQCFNPDLAPETPEALQAIFDTGHEVGRLAHRLYPGGVLIEEDYQNHEAAVRATVAAMQTPEVPAVFEAAFVQDGVRIRADVLARAPGGAWRLLEVKSTNSLKDHHLYDVAVQCHVLERAGLVVEQAVLVHLNREYVYDGIDLRPSELFTLCDLTEEVAALRDEVVSKVGELRAMLAGGVPPEVEVAGHCHDPYGCEFWDYCAKDMPEFCVTQLSGIRQGKLDELTAMGIQDIRLIPESFPLSDLQARIRDCVVRQEEYAGPELSGTLRDVKYPIHFLDFETFMTAIPRYAGTWPYQTLPFQWSDHVLFEDGTLEHREYLCAEDKDPREEFTEALLEALGDSGTIFIYTNYEVRIIRELAEQCPRYSGRLLALMDRFCDLKALVKQYYYHPSFYGSFSLKDVLPAVVPSMSYDELDVQDGAEASLAYLNMMDPATPPDVRESIRRALLTYCGQDTLALVRIRKELLRRAVDWR